MKYKILSEQQFEGNHMAIPNLKLKDCKLIMAACFQLKDTTHRTYPQGVVYSAVQIILHKLLGSILSTEADL
jgi:hypothetical protein